MAALLGLPALKPTPVFRNQRYLKTARKPYETRSSFVHGSSFRLDFFVFFRQGKKNI
jgi:hypothetical protein